MLLTLGIGIALLLFCIGVAIIGDVYENEGETIKFLFTKKQKY